MVVVGRKGSHGKLQYSPNPVFAIDTTYFIDPARTEANIRWLYYSLSTLGLDRVGQDVGVPGLSREYAYAQRVPLPSHTEQRAIADYLDTETGRIDRLISKKRRMIELLRERRQALITAAVTGESAVPADRDRRRDQNPRSSDPGSSRAGHPVSWESLPLRRIFRVVHGGTPRSDPENWKGTIAWATPVDLGRRNGKNISATDRTLTPKGLSTGSRAVSPGSLLVSSRAPIGYIAQTTCLMAFNQGCKGLEPTQPVDVRFFRYQLSSMTENLQSCGQGSTFPELSGDVLAATPVTLPPLVDQRAIADYLDSETSRIDTLVKKISRTIDLLQERRSALITDAVTGNLPVSLAPPESP